MRKLAFYFREAIKALKRSRLAGGVAFFSLLLFALFCSGVLVADDMLDRAQKDLLRQFEVEVFLKPGKAVQLQDVSENLRAREGVLEAVPVDKDSARVRFASNYGNELFGLLEENPLPASVVLTYNPEVVSVEWLADEATLLGNLSFVDEVVYEGELLTRLESIQGRVFFMVIIALAIVGLVSLFFSAQTVRVAVRTGDEWARVVRLVGGTERTVRRPFVVMGFLTGLGAGTTGALVVAVVITVLHGGELPAATMLIKFLILMIGTAILGMFGALAAVPTISKRQNDA